MTILGCGAEMAKLMAVSDEDVQTIEDVLKERLDMGIARPEAQRQAVADAIAMLGAERAMVMGAITAKVAALPQAAKPATHQDPGAAPATAPEQMPMHEGEIQAAWLGQDLDEPIPYTFVLGIRSAERFNGIKETP